MNNQSVYLGKAGKTFGPFSLDEFEKMRNSGEIYNYTWILDAVTQQWKPLDLPPPPVNDPETPRIQAEIPPPPKSPVRPLSLIKPLNATLEAICHDYRSVVCGRITRVNDSECELLIRDEDSLGRTFADQAEVLMNILDPASGKSVNISTKFKAVTRKNGSWTYVFLWSEYPELIALMV